MGPENRQETVESAENCLYFKALSINGYLTDKIVVLNWYVKKGVSLQKKHSFLLKFNCRRYLIWLLKPYYTEKVLVEITFLLNNNKHLTVTSHHGIMEEEVFVSFILNAFYGGESFSAFSRFFPRRPKKKSSTSLRAGGK
jgi:hypothetical protein